MTLLHTHMVLNLVLPVLSKSAKSLIFLLRKWANRIYYAFTQSLGFLVSVNSCQYVYQGWQIDTADGDSVVSHTFPVVLISHESISSTLVFK